MANCNSNITFGVNGHAVLCNMIDGDIRARQSSRGNPEKKAYYKEKGIISTSPSITTFMRNHPEVFGNKKLINSNGTNFFGGMLPFSSLSRTGYENALKIRMQYEYDLTPEEIEGMKSFFDDFDKLAKEPEVQAIVNETESYKRSIESAWRLNETSIMKYIKTVLGYEPENAAKVSAYIMYPSFDIHRCCQVAENKTSLFFAKSNETDINKILASLTHQAVHQPMLPYKNTMTKEEKSKFHAFIKFLTDKDVYYQLSEKSYLDIVTEKEDPEIMAIVYPFWLGYRYRNADKEGLNPVEKIEEAIQRDKRYYDSLPVNSKKRKLYSKYEFDKLDPKKIAQFFREKRAITPYQFAKIDFGQRDQVYKSQYLSGKSTLSVSGQGEIR